MSAKSLRLTKNKTAMQALMLKVKQVQQKTLNAFRTILWIKNNVATNHAKLNSKYKLIKSYKSHKDGKSVSVINSDIENFLANLVR